MNKNTLFVFEFISGGGFNKINIPSSLFCEGFGMLKSIISDFKVLDFEIISILDYRASFLTKFLQADRIRIVNPEDNYLLLFKKVLEECSYCFIIAPESSNTLYNLTKLVKKSNKELLSASLKCIHQSTSKIKVFKFLSKNKIPTPRTYRIPSTRRKLDVDFILKKFKNLNCSIIIKPEDGVGAESIYYFERENEILNFFRDFNKQLTLDRHYIMQEFINGRDLSLSLLGFSHVPKSQIPKPIILSINTQNVKINNQGAISEYLGGTTPVEKIEGLIEKVEMIFKKVEFKGFNGYFGIDFISSEKESFSFIEINPRLTTSYLGVRNVINYNCAELIFKSKMNIFEPVDIKFLNFSQFFRIELISENVNSIKQLDEKFLNKLLREIPELVTPPISFSKSNHFSCLIATKTKDSYSSKKRIDEIFLKFEKLGFNIIKSAGTGLK